MMLNIVLKCTYLGTSESTVIPYIDVNPSGLVVARHFSFLLSKKKNNLSSFHAST